MPLITTTTQPVYFAVKQGANIVISGLADIGGAVGVPPALTEVHDTDPNAFLGKVTTGATSYNPIPGVGEWCEGGTIYGYNGGLVICRRSHFRTAFPLDQTPDLWSVYRVGGGVMDWIANEPVLVGTHRTYLGIEYVCLQPHVTQVDYTPVATLNVLWAVYVNPATPQPWVQPGSTNPYMMGDRVTFNGHLWESKIDNNVWSPTAYPAGWTDLGVYP